MESYSPARTADAAPDLQALAAEKREQLAAAYHILAHRTQRVESPVDHGASTEVLDFRPLPPARGQERPKVAEPVPARPTAGRRIRQAGWRSWIMPTLVALGGLGLLLLLILSGVRTIDGPQALATPTVAGVDLPFTATQLAQFRAAADANNTAQTWTALGNALFDNLQTLRENVPQSPQYRGQLQEWLQVVQAYDRALGSEDSPAVRSSRAVALMNYGLDALDPARVREAVAEVERGIQRGVNDPRALLNYGLVLASTDPPRMGEALAQWRKIGEVAPNSPEAQSAQNLLQRFGQ